MQNNMYQQTAQHQMYDILLQRLFASARQSYTISTNNIQHNTITL